MKSINPILTQTSDYSQAEAFINAIVGGSAVTWQTFDDSENKDKALTQCWHDTLVSSWNKLQRLNDQGAGVFVTIQETDGTGKRTTDNITRVRALFIDCDNGIPDSWHLQPSIIVNTSTNKCHAYWLLSEPVIMSAEVFRSCQERLITHYESDKAIKDLARVMRLPGLLHNKQTPTLVSISEASGIRYTVDQILEGLPELTPAKPKQTKAEVSKPNYSDVPANTNFRETLENFANKLKQAKEGERNSTLNISKYTLAGLFPDKLEAIDECLFTIATDYLGLSEEETRCTLASASKGTEKPITLMNNGGSRSKGNQMRQELSEFFGEDLQWDEMENQLRFRGVHMSIERLQELAEQELDRDYPDSKFERFSVVYAEQRSYHPVRAYLQSLTVANDAEPILSAFFQAIGVDKKLHRIYWRRWLISAVARALSPGCKADNALVLQGGQGIGKTTLLQDIFGKQFFQTVGEHKSQVDEILSMHNSWCCEYGEIENALSQKDIASIKAFLSKEDDLFRRPYGKASQRYSRSFVVAGTTNKTEFLKDTTGNRRFWVVNITQQVDRKAVQEMRDDLWSAILKLYLDGEQWELTNAEKLMSAEDTAQYEQENPWTERIATYITHHNPCTLADIMENALGFDTSRLNDKKAQMEVGAVLSKLGATKRRVGQKKVTYWSLPTLDMLTSEDVKTTETYEEVY
ncbi:virulence-associated E family protein [Nostoc sp. MS1]|uniref:virulence-associated E family protein n=1 Tax=Nostoc sp. MS1 TaxID=2764711 RepID=UPI001CC807D3|nr:virulence-associated E family protein [Nostoc sp. MS1]BCL34581.1 hypothetical protein NSMS1_10280 [Nostoc sp. MS1]